MKLLGTLLILFITGGNTCAQGVGYNPFPNTYSYINSNGPLGTDYSTSTFDVYFDVYIPGVTEPAGQGAGITAWIIIRRDTSVSDPSYSNATVAYAQYNATYVSDTGNNDRYRVTIPAGIPNGRYTWESYAAYNSNTYRSWDYNNEAGSTNLHYFTVGPTGIFRSMIILNDNGGGNTYYDMRKFQPGNPSLPAQFTGPLGSGYCSSNSFTIAGAEMNVYKNTQAGYGVTNVSAARIYYRVVAISATGTASCLNNNSNSPWNSFTLNFRDNCPIGYPGNNSNKFTGGGSCQNENALNSNTDQRWDSTDANVNVMALASAACMPSNTTGPITYRLDIYTEADVYTEPPKTTVQARDPAVANTYYSTTFTVRSLDVSPQNGFNGGAGCNPILPSPFVKLFSGIRKSKDAQLKWETNWAGDIEKFELQRSATTSDFSTIYHAGYSVNSNLYTYTDEGIFYRGKQFYYRLKIIKRSGQTVYSAIVRLKHDAVAGISSIVPNPFTDKISFSVALENKDRIAVSLTDVLGRRVVAKSNNCFAGVNTIELNNLSSLPKGFYLIEIRNGEGTILLADKLIHQ